MKNTIDLFECIETLPQPVQKAIENFASDVVTYQDCENLQKELNSYGYDFDFGLSAEPINLKKI